MFSLKQIFGGSSTEKTADDHPLTPILNEAAAVVQERERLLEALKVEDEAMANARQELTAATAVSQAEETEAALAGGLAVASEVTLQKVRNATLRIRSIEIRKQKLNRDIAALNRQIAALWKRAKEVRDELIQKAISNVRESLEASAREFLKQYLRAWALLRHSGGTFDEPIRFQMNPAGLNVFNPVVGPKSVHVHGGLFALDGANYDTSRSWRTDPDAAALDEAIQNLKDRIAPLGDLAKQIGA